MAGPRQAHHPRPARPPPWVVSPAGRLIAALGEHRDCHAIVLEKDLGRTRVVGQGMPDEPAWRWPDQG
jgi:predicted ATPase